MIRISFIKEIFLIFPSYVIKIFLAESDSEEVEEDSSEDKMKNKKKREAPKSSISAKEGNKKKETDSFKWSNIFGLDRKKKSSNLVFHPLEDNDRRRKRCGPGECIDEPDYSKWPNNWFKNLITNFLYPDEEDYEDEDYRRKKKQSREEKLDTMDRKLKNIENLIIEDTTKYYDNHDGVF